MAKNKKKRTRTVSVRQDYRKGGKVKREQKFTGGFNTVALGAMNRIAQQGQAQIDELNQSAQTGPTFGAVPKGTKTGRPDVGMTPSPAPSEKTEPPSPDAGEPTAPPVSVTPTIPTTPTPAPTPDFTGNNADKSVTAAPDPAPSANIMAASPVGMLTSAPEPCVNVAV